MGDPELGAWLRRERERRGWNKHEMVRRLIEAAREDGDTNLPGSEGTRRNVYRWEAEGGVSERYRFYYCRAFGIDVAQFGPGGEPVEVPQADQPASPAPPASDVASHCPFTAGSPLPGPAGMFYRGGQGPAWGAFSAGQEVVMAAAHESSEHAAERDPYGLGDITTDQLRGDVVRLSREMDTGSPLSTFLELRRVRDRIHLLLDRRLLLREQGELYFLLGCVSGMMGAVATQLGYLDAAEEFIRAGWAYASIIEHDPLRAMLRLKLAIAADHQGRYSESRDLAADGLQYVSQGSPGAELHVIHARAAARLGDLDTARQSIGLADDAQDSDYTDDLLEIGGEFAVTRATHYSLAGRALTDINGAERDAAGKLDQAIGLYDAGPGPDEEFWFAGKPIAGVNLAIVRLRSGALDAAVEALQPTLALPAEQRIADITNRLADVRRELAAPIFTGSPQATALGEAIESFTREAVTSALHTLTG